jgi:hypothetical protein
MKLSLFLMSPTFSTRSARAVIHRMNSGVISRAGVLVVAKKQILSSRLSLSWHPTENRPKEPRCLSRKDLAHMVETPPLPRLGALQCSQHGW